MKSVVFSFPASTQGHFLLSLSRHALAIVDLDKAATIDLQRLQIASQLLSVVLVLLYRSGLLFNNDRSNHQVPTFGCSKPMALLCSSFPLFSAKYLSRRTEYAAAGLLLRKGIVLLVSTM